MAAGSGEESSPGPVEAAEGLPHPGDDATTAGRLPGGGHAARHWVRPAVGVALAGAAMYAVVSSAGGFADAIEALGDANPLWLLPGAACEAVSFALLGLLVRRLVGPRGDVGRLTAVRLGLVLSGLGNVLPAAPAEGMAMVAGELRRRGVDTRRVRLMLAFSEWYTMRAAFAVVALNALAVAVVAEVRFPGRFPHAWAVGGLGAAVLAGLVVSAWLLSRRQTAEWVAAAAARARFWRPLASLEERRAVGAAWYSDAQEVLGGRRERAAIVALAVGSCVGDAMCFAFAMAAAGVHARGGILILAYGAAMVSAFVPLLPAGVGAVESVVPALLRRSGTPLVAGLAGVLVYRALATVLPALAGALALLRLRLAPATVPPPSME
jgi:uncharacterized membrane protein YbhN (UPF0104 family)